MLPGQTSRDRIRRRRGGGIIQLTVSNFCCCSLLTDPLCSRAGAGGAELAHANLLPAPSPPQFPRESKAQRAAWIHSKDCEPLNSLSAQFQQTSFKQSSAAVGMENLAANSAKSSYLSPSERHQPRKESSFRDVLSVPKHISHLYIPAFLILCPSPGSEGQWICRKERSENLHSEKILVAQGRPDATGQIKWHWKYPVAFSESCPHTSGCCFPG